MKGGAYARGIAIGDDVISPGAERTFRYAFSPERSRMYCKFEEVLGPPKKSRATMKKTNKAVQLKLELQWDEDISEKTEELEKVIFEIEQKMLRTNGVIHDE